LSLSTPIIADKLASRGVTAAGPDIETWVPEAALRVALANREATDFQKTLTGQTITSGVMTLTDTTLLFGDFARVTVNTTPALYAPSVDALRATLPSDVYWYACEGVGATSVSLTFKNTDGSLTSLTSSSNVTIVTPAVPVLSAWPAKYEPALIDELVRMAGGAN
jgi:hypothetical protein